MYEKMIGDHYQSTITPNAKDILKKRYFMKDDNGNVIEDFNGMCARVAKCVSDVHKTVHFESDEKTNNYFKEYYSMMSNLDFLPNTPTLINAGKENGQSLSACFVCPVENNINEIFETIKNAVLIHKSGGGTGFNFSKVNNPTNKFIKDYFNINFSLNDNHKDYDKFKKSKFKYCNKQEYGYIDYKIDKKYIFIEDDLSSIFDFNIVYNWLTSFNYLDKKINVIIDFSHIRPEGEIINTSKGEASGPVSFMYAWDAFFEFISNNITPISTIKFFDACTNAVKQGGVRRGANMGILNSDNKYLEEFIHCKENESDITNFNLSVGVVNDKIFQDKLIDDIAKCAWKNGEPGLIFLDKINDKNTVKNHSIEATNPCGEQPLLPYESCNLGSINLSNMVKVKHVKRPKFDWEKFKHTIWNAVEFLDDVIDANNYPIPEIEKASKRYRKIGLGVMGFADVLTMLDFPYDSAQAKSIARKIAKTLKEESEKISKMRESLYGPCPGCDDIIDGHSKRNAALTTIAPTGSISTICGCSSGIEPIFSVVYTRHTLNFEKDMYCIHPIFDEVIKDRYLDRYDEIIKDVYEKGSVTKVDYINNSIKDVFKSAGDIHFRQHIYMQSIWQEFVDNSISKTINFAENATINDIRDSFDYAYKGYVKDFNKHLHSVYEPLIRDVNSDLGFCKGITVYRDKSRDKQVLETGSKNSSKQVTDVCTINSSVNNINSIENYINLPPKFNTIETVSNTTNSIRKRGDSLRGYTERIKIGCGELYVTVNFDDDGVREIFTTNGKSGGCHSQSEATCRMVSTALKYNIPTDVIIKQLKGIRCPSSIKNSGGCSLSCPDAIARCIEKCIGYEKNKKTDSYSEYYQQQFTKYYDEAIVNLTNIETLDSSKCPECGSPLEFEGGCQVCRSCGYSKCH